jgi:hypothetical protein
MSENKYQLSDVHFIKRITVGSNDPTSLKSDSEISQALDLLNRCIAEYPKGTIIGVEKSFNIIYIGEHQVVMQYLVYHVGFPRKPAWLD